MNNKMVLDFLTQLEKHNTLDWMHAHKAEYLEAKAEFHDFVQQLLFGLSARESWAMDLRPGALTFRLNRDIRFSKDKTPYKTYFSAHLSPGGKQVYPIGCYVQVQPGGKSMLGGGLHAMGVSKLVGPARAYIAEHGEEFLEIVNAPGFRDNFTLEGEQLKLVPRGYDRDHPMGEYLRYKSWDIAYPLANDVLLAEDGGVSYILEKYWLLRPFNDLFNRALAGVDLGLR